MRTPEDVARDALGCEQSREECVTHLWEWPCTYPDVRRAADLIRARDAEVAEQVRAEVLADVGDHSSRQAEAYRELADKYGGYYQGIRSAWQELDRWVNVQEPAGCGES